MSGLMYFFPLVVFIALYLLSFVGVNLIPSDDGLGRAAKWSDFAKPQMPICGFAIATYVFFAIMNPQYRAEIPIYIFSQICVHIGIVMGATFGYNTRHGYT